MFKRLLLTLAFSTALSAASLAASAPAAPANDDVSGLFCKDMQDEAQYDKNKFESYKMLVAGKNGWIFRSETDFKTDFALTEEGQENLSDLHRALKTRGIELVILMTPTRGMVHGENIQPEDQKKYKFSQDQAWKSYLAANEEMRKGGIAVVDLKRQQVGKDFFYKRDHHWNASGSRIAAKALAEHIKKMPAYQEVEKISFLPKEGPEMDFYGVSKKVFKTLCDKEQQPEKIIQRYTERADEVAGEDALFGDAKPPQIVLLGTSNSTQEPAFANFAGFLKEELSADILNMSVSGGGLDTAMLAYLNSDEYKNNPAKIAIWEVPSYYYISNHMNFFREAIPAVYGACTTAAAETKGLKITEKTTIALSKLYDKDISGEEYYLYLNFEKPVSKPFSASLLYKKDRNKYRFSHSSRYPQDKEFYLRLEEAATTPLDKVILSVPKELIGNTVDVKLCRQSDSTAYSTRSNQKSGEQNGSKGVIDLLKKL